MTAALVRLLCVLCGLTVVLARDPVSHSLGASRRDRDVFSVLAVRRGASDARDPWTTTAIANLSDEGTTATPRGECEPGDDLFPGSLFDQAQLRQGAVVLYFVAAFYGFCMIALVCENYFLPTVEIICEELGLPPDIAAATFMSLASSAPEGFVNIITTFVTKSSMGVGTTVGSATFNVLGLGAFIGLACRAPIQIRAGPVLRDSVLYVTAISITAAVVWDGRVEWYEALAMVLCSLAYLAFMFTHLRLARWARTLLARTNSAVVLTTARANAAESSCYTVEATASQPGEAKPDKLTEVRITEVSITEVSITEAKHPEADPAVVAAVAGQLKAKKTESAARRAVGRAWRFATWPVGILLALTIVDCKRPDRRRFYMITFVLCIVWIALAAYLVSWMLAVIGQTLRISDAVMGMTLLAAGGSTPEAVSAIIMSRKGVGSVGISNGLGANTLNMLMNLGMPWLVRSLVWPNMPWCVLSNGLFFELVSLVSAVLVLNLVLVLTRYRLTRVQGVSTFFVYVLFIITLVLIELDVFNLYSGTTSLA